MNIFECLGEYPNIKDLTEEQMVEIVSMKTGIDFCKGFTGYEGKEKGIRYRIQYNRYSDTKKPFIAVGYRYPNGGAGMPCDTVEQAIKFFNTFRKGR